MTAPRNAAPLQGMKVVEMTSVVLGPYACQMLGDLGAEVIKIEPPGGDTNRHLGPHRNHEDMCSLFLTCNRNKRSICLDLKSEEGRSAALKIMESADHHPLAQVQYYHDVDAMMDIPWDPGGVTRPTVATGCLIKLLNFNLESQAISFLYCMTPGFYQDNISYHDCPEESYHLWGTSWMMQFGEVPTGGYFWRPAYINHGAFASEFGCIALGRTDSKLYNHFHYNPWSTPVENADRSMARLALRDPLLDLDHSHHHHHKHD